MISRQFVKVFFLKKSPQVIKTCSHIELLATKKGLTFVISDKKSCWSTKELEQKVMRVTAELNEI